MTIATEPALSAIRRYQQRCHRDYARSINLPQPYTYPDGNPIRPLPPVQTPVGGLMIVGAYPSARFEYRPSTKDPKRQRLIPVADNLQPFAYEQYFDGVKVRTLESGGGLRRYILDPLSVAFEDCWITDLVKVFLYKPDHVSSCGDAVPSFPVPELRSRFLSLAQVSLNWLRDECNLCRPKLILTLGQEVGQAITRELNATADDLLSRPLSYPASIGGFPTLYLPHPDACRRSDKWMQNTAERLLIAQDFLNQ